MKRIPAILAALALASLGGCAGGQYLGPSIGMQLGYDGATLGVTIYGGNPPAKPSPTPAPATDSKTIKPLKK